MHKQIHLPNSHINESTKRATYKVGHIPRWTGGHLLLDADPHPGTPERNTGVGTGSGYVPMFKTGMKYIHVTSNIASTGEKNCFEPTYYICFTVLTYFIFLYFVFFFSLPFVTLVVSFRTRETLNGKISNNLLKQIGSYLAIVTFKM